jgi:carboxymethylenebutenolidase
VETRSDDTRIDDRLAVVSRPVDAGPWPGVVMMHEGWGIDDVLRRQAAHLASMGYVVVAPDLFGDGFKMRCMVQAMRAMQAQRGRPFELAEACRRWLTEQPDCTGRMGVIGFCMGGGFALLLANRGFDVSSVNYGMVPENLDDVLNGACPIVASYGGRDKQFGPKAYDLQAGLERHNVPHDLKVYDTAGHSFLNDQPNGPWLLRPLLKVTGAGPEPVAAADAWHRIEAFFASYLRD